jgi:hypothetical protein
VREEVSSDIGFSFFILIGFVAFSPLPREGLGGLKHLTDTADASYKGINLFLGIV